MARIKITAATSKDSASRKPQTAANPKPIKTARGRRGRRVQEAKVAVTPASMPAPAPQPNVEPGSKLTRIIALLRRPEGATVADLMQLTGWLSHSVRGALSGALKRKMGLAVASSVDPDRGRVYHIAEPVEATLPVSLATSSVPRPSKSARVRHKPSTTGATA